MSHVTCQASGVTCYVSSVFLIFLILQSGGACWGRLCYQQSLPCLVLVIIWCCGSLLQRKCHFLGWCNSSVILQRQDRKTQHIYCDQPKPLPTPPSCFLTAVSQPFSFLRQRQELQNFSFLDTTKLQCVGCTNCRTMNLISTFVVMLRANMCVKSSYQAKVFLLLKT